MKVLVTGGAGFIGSHVVDRLQARGLEPRIFDLVPSPHHRTERRRHRARRPLRPRRGRSARSTGCDAVMHLAAVADVDQVTKDPAHADLVNVRGTQTLLDGARELEIGRFVYASTIWVYGDAAGPEAVDEDTPLGLPEALLHRHEDRRRDVHRRPTPSCTASSTRSSASASRTARARVPPRWSPPSPRRRSRASR